MGHDTEGRCSFNTEDCLRINKGTCWAHPNPLHDPCDRGEHEPNCRHKRPCRSHYGKYEVDCELGFQHAGRHQGNNGTVMVFWTEEDIQAYIRELTAGKTASVGKDNVVTANDHTKRYDALKDHPNPGYHIKNIPKWDVNTTGKIYEELMELIDAERQGSKIMMAVELSDMIGAIQSYAETKLNMSLEDLIKFSDITKRAFKNGHR